jgi:predicted GIY-YIG superfamily endonuclease
MKDHQSGRRRNRHQAALQPLASNEALHCRVYVIELDAAVTRDPAFIAKNPKYVPGRPSYYVGMTSLEPSDRFLEHILGTRNSSRICRQYGRKLRMDLVPNLKPTRRTWAMRREKRLAADIRRGGDGAWQA